MGCASPPAEPSVAKRTRPSTCQPPGLPQAGRFVGSRFMRGVERWLTGAEGVSVPATPISGEDWQLPRWNVASPTAMRAKYRLAVDGCGQWPQKRGQRVHFGVDERAHRRELGKAHSCGRASSPTSRPPRTTHFAHSTGDTARLLIFPFSKNMHVRPKPPKVGVERHRPAVHAET